MAATPRLSKPTPSTAPGLVYIVGGQVELPDGGKLNKVKIGTVPDDAAFRDASVAAYRVIYKHPDQLRPIIPAQHLVDTTFALKVPVPNLRLAEMLIFARLKDLGAEDNSDGIFTNEEELLARPAIKRLLEQVSTATWVFQDKKGEPVSAFAPLPAGWPGRKRASVGGSPAPSPKPDASTASP